MDKSYVVKLGYLNVILNDFKGFNSKNKWAEKKTQKIDS